MLPNVLLIGVVDFDLLIMHVRSLTEKIRASGRQVKNILD